MKKDGFNNERIFIVPNNKTNSDTKTFVTDIGYFPNAKYHYRERAEGSEAHILILCIAGKGFVNNDFIVHTESLVIIPPKKRHTYGADEASPWDIFWVHFVTDEDFTFDDITVINLTKEQTKMYMDIFASMIHSLSNGFNKKSFAFTSNALKFMIGLIDLQTLENPSTPIVIRKIEIYILEHLNDSISVQKVCHKFRISRSYLHYLYKKEFGISPISYLTNLKLEIASNYLQVTNMSIKQIALSLGYQDPYYFSRLFKKKYSLSPKHYRKSTMK